MKLQDDFTVSVDAADGITGISAFDRASTIKFFPLQCDAEDLVQRDILPGRDQEALAWSYRTFVDLSTLAGLQVV